MAIFPCGNGRPTRPLSSPILIKFVPLGKNVTAGCDLKP